jgi:hypothetical protein
VISDAPVSFGRFARLFRDDPWSANTDSFLVGKFAGGKALVMISASSCGPDGCAFEFPEQTVQLHGGPH